MKYHKLIAGLMFMMTAVACTIDEPAFSVREKNPAEEDLVFSAVIDEDNTTKTYIDAGLNILWNKNDRISIFNNVTMGAEYVFLGEDGDPDGKFQKTDVEENDDVFYGGTDLGGDIYAIYPYSPDTKIVQDGTITYAFPDVQTYRESSFGPGANVMVAKASTLDKMLRFKNAMGYLSFKLWGDDVHVSSVILKANGGEALAGKGTITAPEGFPVVSMDEASSVNKVRLYCGDVLLGSTPENSTEFWFALPPVSFTQAKGGFTLIVTTTDGRIFRRNAPMDLAIQRKTVERMAPLKVMPEEGTSGKLNSISSTRGGIRYEAEKEGDSFLLTLPTVTDFSELVVDFDIDGDMLMVDGKEVTSGVTPIDVSHPQSLVVCNGDIEKTYTLSARNTGLPVVRITTEGFSREDIEADPDHESWFPGASIRIENADGTVDLDTAPMSIKGRGNATWKYNKRPYALKMEKKVKVLGMKKHKRWILLANWKDRTLLRNDAAFWLSKQSGLHYTVSGYFVELEFNGEHRGNYYLCEQIKINENRLGLTEIDDSEIGTSDPYLITGPYLMEIDNNYDETFKFLSGFYTSSNWSSTPLGLKYMFADPDTDLSSEAVSYMENYIKQMEALIKKIRDNRNPDYDGYKQYLDMDSAIWFMFVNELTGNGDFFNTDGAVNTTYYGPHSTYLYKDRDIMNDDGTTTTSKLFMGPVWDFDYKTFISTLTTTSWGGHTSQETRSNKWVGANQSNYYYYYLCKDPEFKARMLSLWEEYKTRITPAAFNEYIDGMADYLRLSEEFNTRMWGYTNTDQDQAQNGDNLKSFQEAVDLMKQAFAEKRAFMDQNLPYLNQ